jgi:phenol hydroxylase P0 protein
MQRHWHVACEGKRVRHHPDAMNPTTESQLPAVDTSLRFVRVLERRPDGLVSFEFAIGWPELAVELMLPAPAFEAFCANNRVQRLDT